ncbi:transforming growth factor beta regulator 1 [Procambarus clarkii]|uniref:Transforming growth factor beta regulator 1 n=1 Tax=Procambarus clarkii TaxID=6728 RepID=A0AA49ICT2_PROCL|nr:transforming growth factor beta regulator 1-like [Procambarus clarkii]XP_045609140.1 transforming growth factor beta regulator 1-like [Procambarus clarkii]WDW19327.1 transforming growth factor beta regulator 1 [Procambarus clarkii]
MSSVWNTAESLLLGPSMDSARGMAGHLSEVAHSVNDAEDDMLSITNTSTAAVVNPQMSAINLPGRSSPAGTPPGSGRVLTDKGRGRGSSLPPAIAERLARHKAQEQLVFKRKLKHLKCIIRDFVFENAALCDQVAEAQQQVVVAAEERTFLLKRLCQHQTTTDQHNQLNPKSNSYFILGSGSVDNWDSKKPKLASLKRKLLDPSQGSPSAITSPVGTEKIVKARKSGSTKPKRLCPPITLDSAGRPIFPITLGPLTIHSLGEIVSERDSYHSEQCIFPVGFCSSRIYASLRDPLKPVLYTCKILDGGLIPRFEVVCEDEEDSVVVGNSPSDCHNHILQTINLALDMDLLTIRPEGRGSEERGCRFFGLTHPSVQNVLQACPGARKCTQYKWVKFEVCRSEAEVESVFEAEKEASLCHEALLRNIRFARHHVTSP